MINFRENLPINRLFLVCPTDNMELIIRKKFIGEIFFCSALGVHFEFDIRMQNDLISLVCENGIEQVIFVSAINNVFYKQAFEKQKTHSYPVSRALAKTKEKISDPLMCSGIFFPNFYSLAASHLADQKERLLSTHYLGNHLTRENIAVKAYIYQPQKKVYYSLEEIVKRGDLLNGISCN